MPNDMQESGQVTFSGPASRDDFLAAQRRHRRAAQALNALAVIAIILVSVPLAAIVFPLLFGIVALFSLLFSVATGGASLLDGLLATGGHFVEGDDAIFEAIVMGLVIVLPGALLILSIWVRSLQVLASLEPAQLVESYGARLLRTADFEERQLSNVVEELAIASAIPPPTVRIVDSDSVNAAALAPGADGVGAAAAFNLAADLLHGPLAREARERLRTPAAPASQRHARRCTRQVSGSRASSGSATFHP